MQIDINGCFAGDIHAICIKKGKHYLTANPQIGWSESLEECACFLSEAKALKGMAEARELIEIADAELIWTDTRKSIYADVESLRKFERKVLGKEDR